MKYMTIEWWRGDDASDSVDPFAAYKARLDEVRDKLPEEFFQLSETQLLHDAHLRQMTIVQADRSAVLEFDCFEGDERLTLNYLQLESFVSTVHVPGLSGPRGYGDLGYVEADLLPSGALEHRLLFSSGIEFHLVFRQFVVRRVKL